MPKAYIQYSAPTSTPQTQPILGRESEMVANNAGGYGFALDIWSQLHRFLILGTENGTYYVGEAKLTRQNATAAIACIKADGVRAVEMAHSINVGNQAPKTDQQLFLLALAMQYGDQATKNRVAALAPDMLRTGTHILHLAAMFDSMGGWNRSKRRIIANWFNYTDAGRLAYQVIKYQNRDGWAMRDLLRVSHPKIHNLQKAELLNWICGKEVTGTDLPPHLHSYLMMQAMLRANGDHASAALYGVKNGLPREALPTESLNERAVIKALLPNLPIHALLRNLGNMTLAGLDSDDIKIVCEKILCSAENRNSRVHPFTFLLAQLIYAQGHGQLSRKRWVPDSQILSSLEEAYDDSFSYAAPTGKKLLIGIDNSGSMRAPCVGTPIAASDAAAAMAITLARLESKATVVAFSNDFQYVVPVTKRTSPHSLGLPKPGGTDLTAIIRWALNNKEFYDAFILLTDNETWAGNSHVSEALPEYRRGINPNAKLLCFSMAANHANVIDPKDVLSLGAAGLDANLPTIASEFLK